MLRNVQYYFQVFTLGIFQTVVLWVQVVLSHEFTLPDLCPPKTGSLLLTVTLKWAIVGGRSPVPWDYRNLILCLFIVHVNYFIRSCDTWFIVVNFSYFLFVAVSEHELNAAVLLIVLLFLFLWSLSSNGHGNGPWNDAKCSYRCPTSSHAGTADATYWTDDASADDRRCTATCQLPLQCRP